MPEVPKSVFVVKLSILLTVWKDREEYEVGILAYGYPPLHNLDPSCYHYTSPEKAPQPDVHILWSESALAVRNWEWFARKLGQEAAEFALQHDSRLVIVTQDPVSPIYLCVSVACFPCNVIVSQSAAFDLMKCPDEIFWHIRESLLGLLQKNCHHARTGRDFALFPDTCGLLSPGV